uniref:Uncharacterized protein n=1 Tax=Romanomermis culicivorax TaxID=13658 RepID=A0A915K8A6_ROMCU
MCARCKVHNGSSGRPIPATPSADHAASPGHNGRRKGRGKRHEPSASTASSLMAGDEVAPKRRPKIGRDIRST